MLAIECPLDKDRTFTLRLNACAAAHSGAIAPYRYAHTIRSIVRLRGQADSQDLLHPLARRLAEPATAQEQARLIHLSMPESKSGALRLAKPRHRIIRPVVRPRACGHVWRMSRNVRWWHKADICGHSQVDSRSPHQLERRAGAAKSPCTGRAGRRSFVS